MPQRTGPSALPLAGIGILVGLLSGLFGIGGGTLIVPALVLWLGMSQRKASGTSVAAILPTAIVGVITYGLAGHVDWIAGICLAIGAILGAQVGSYLLDRINLAVLQWSFMAFLFLIIVSLWVIVPERSSSIDLTVTTMILLVLSGFITGLLSGLLGVGGGVIVVPGLMFLFSASDLLAKGTSLFMMVPGSISGTIGNSLRKNIDLKAAIIIGLVASPCVPLGALLANWIDPFWGNVAFSLYLSVLLGQLLWKKLREDNDSQPDSAL